ncbi:MAG TPA: HAD-IIA family hydrolase [Candidatus Hydrogenedentes bacterium]|nr:HAD-IIA family hydrolase [Candidatus Hydrogenedentota bacterium]HPG67320.1 HAD-IIA family hydrolase [Candidatus Hydrogenedentota bacterium]
MADLGELRFFLLDMDGTVYLGPNPIEGAAEFLAFLGESGRQRLFFTNNPTADAAQYSAKLARMGIKAQPADILTSGEATARYLVSETDFRRVYVVGMTSFETELARAGIAVTDEDPQAVVLAFDKSLTYAKLEKACLLLREGLPYIATNPDKVCPTEYGYIPDCGATAELLRAAADRWPKFIGKPNAEMIRMGMQKLGATAEHTAMVGDRLYTDMQMAYNADITSILVLSGESTREDVARAERAPDFVFESVRDLHARLAAIDAA